MKTAADKGCADDSNKKKRKLEGDSSSMDQMMKKRRVGGGGAGGASAAQKPPLGLPDDVVFELLGWLPPKELGKCECVCKSWQSIISSPEFSEFYRNRHLGLMVYFAEIDLSSALGLAEQVPFFYSTLRAEGPAEEFSCRSKIAVSKSYSGITQLINGLACVYDNNCLTVWNIFTGEKMKLQDPVLPHQPSSISTYYFGYDPASRVYKLLRLITTDHFMFFHRIEAEILTLGPRDINDSSSSSWRVLEDKVLTELQIFRILPSKGFAVDGVLYWMMSSPFELVSLISFDLNKEKFRRVKFPTDTSFPSWAGEWKLAQSMGRLALWLPPIGDYDGSMDKCFSLFILQNDDGDGGDTWTKHSIPLPSEFKVFAKYTIAAGNLPTGQLLLLNPMVVAGNSTPVYSYDHHKSKLDKFVVGVLPHPKHMLPKGDFPLVGENLKSWMLRGNFPVCLSCSVENSERLDAALR